MAVQGQGVHPLIVPSIRAQLVHQAFQSAGKPLFIGTSIQWIRDVRGGRDNLVFEPGHAGSALALPKV